MKTRKIQQVGGGTYTVSIPQDWAQREDISQGDVVDLHTHVDGVLVVQARDRKSDPTGDVTVELTDADAEQIRQSLTAAYTAGYTEITLATEESFGGRDHRVVTEAANVLAGATVTTTTDQEVVVQVLLDPAEISLCQLVRELSFVATRMQRRAMRALSTTDSDPDLATSDDQADRLFAMTERSFQRALSRLSEVDSLGMTRPELFELWSTARDLERVADHAERIDTIASDLDEPPDGDHGSALQRLGARAQDVVDFAVSGVVDTDGTDAVCRALGLRAEVREEVAALDRRLFGDATADYRLARVLDSVQRTAEHGGNIAERGLQGAIRRGDSVSFDWEEATVEADDSTSLPSTVEDD